MADADDTQLIDLDLEESVWEHCFSVFPLVVIGTREADGSVTVPPVLLPYMRGVERITGR